MDLILRQGKLIDPGSALHQVADLGISDGQIVEIGRHISCKGAQEIDATGFLVMPGFIDMHVHLREPGRETAETIETGTRAAAKGGFTAVACMPNTQPINDSAAVTALIRSRIQATAKIPVYPIGAITVGSRGEALAELEAMVGAGVVALSDDGRSLQNNRLMREAMQKARDLDVPIIDHCEDADLAAGGCMNEGIASAQLAVKGIPSASEEVQVARDAILGRLTGARVHIAHISSAYALEIVKRAKMDGIAMTCEVTPHHLLLTEERVGSLDTSAKVNPPLRTRRDVEALVAGLAEGVIDVIATDHAPHTPQTKMLDFSAAPFGVIGLETAVSLILDRLVRPGILSLDQMARAFSLNPARILKLERGLREGMPADLTVMDPDREFEVCGKDFLSLSRNTPFEGWKLRGAPVMTIVCGQIVWSA